MQKISGIYLVLSLVAMLWMGLSLHNLSKSTDEANRLEAIKIEALERCVKQNTKQEVSSDVS